MPHQTKGEGPKSPRDNFLELSTERQAQVALAALVLACKHIATLEAAMHGFNPAVLPHDHIGGLMTASLELLDTLDAVDKGLKT